MQQATDGSQQLHCYCPHFLHKLEFILYSTGAELKLIVKVAVDAIKSGIKQPEKDVQYSRVLF
jgi:hypothetical protein